MRSRLRLFLLVGVAATAVDVGLLLALGSRGLVSADLIALCVAAFFGYLLNRTVTFRGDPEARWVSNPGMFAATAVFAGSIDIALLVGLTTASVSTLRAKIIAVCCAGVVRWVIYRWILLTEVRKELRHRIERPPADGPIRLSVVIPAYNEQDRIGETIDTLTSHCLLYTSPSPRDATLSRMPSSA